MFKRKDLLDIQTLSSNEITHILDVAKEMKPKIDDKSLRILELENKTAVTLFYENSTRTKMSFTLACKYLGVTLADLLVSTSSVNKGESLVDTGVTLDKMGIDTVIIRSSKTGAGHLLAKNIKASVINAGDGTNEHPTQALLDAFTIIENKGSIKGLKVTIIGDILNSRVARSNVFLLSKMGAFITLAGPRTLVSKNMEKLAENVEVTYDVKEAIKDCDVLMGLRVQFERQNEPVIPNTREYHELFGIDKNDMKNMKDDVLIMHPGPVNRGVEMSSYIVDCKNSVINEQVKNGLAVRMAILKILLSNK